MRPNWSGRTSPARGRSTRTTTSAGSTAELAASLELSAAVNEAYNTLRDPFPVPSTCCAGRRPDRVRAEADAAGVPAEMLEAREEIEQARGNAAEAARLDCRIQRTTSRRLMDQVADCFPVRATSRSGCRGERTCSPSSGVC